MDSFKSVGGGIRVDHRLIEELIDTIKKQTDLIDREVTKPLTALVKQDKEIIWKGEAAEKFWADLDQNVILPLGKIGNVHNDFGSLLAQALEMFSKAEEQALPVAEACLRVARDLPAVDEDGRSAGGAIKGRDLDRDFGGGKGV